MRRARSAAAAALLAVAATAGGAAAQPGTLHTVTFGATGPFGGQLVVELRWVYSYVGPDAEYRAVAYECDATFRQQATPAVGLMTTVGCFLGEQPLALPATTPGPRSHSGGAVQTAAFTPQPICVQGAATYAGVVALANVSVPKTCVSL